MQRIPLLLLQDGSVILRKKQLYFIATGTGGKFAMGVNGTWMFLENLNWKTFEIVYSPQI